MSIRIQREGALIDISELAAHLGIPKSTIYSWTHERKIPFYKMGRHLRFDLEKVLSQMESLSHLQSPVAKQASNKDSLEIEEEMRKRIGLPKGG